MNLPLGVLDVATGASGDSKVEPIEPVASEPVKGTDPPIVQNKSLKEEKKRLPAWIFPAILVGLILIIFIIIKIRSK